MSRFKDLTGKRFGVLVVTLTTGKNRQGNYRWECKCDCGNITNVSSSNLIQGAVGSCGCQEFKFKPIHGQCESAEYRTWSSMKQRCSNPKAQNYPRYGGRGIVVCERWEQSFECFLSDMGKRPSASHSIERRDNSANYEPSNCMWVTRKEQANNTRKNRNITFNGERKTITQWAEAVGIKPHTLYCRIDKGWAIERALTTPIHIECRHLNYVSK